MKKLILTCAAICGLVMTGFCQFTDKGYKDIRLEMSESALSKIVKLNKGEYTSTCTYDGIKLEISFEDNKVWSISTKDPKAKVYGVDKPLIGLTLKEVKAILGKKLKAADLGEGPSEEYYIYYKDDAARKNDVTSVVLYFKDGKRLESISTTYNP